MYISKEKRHHGSIYSLFTKQLTNLRSMQKVENVIIYQNKCNMNFSDQSVEKKIKSINPYIHSCLESFILLISFIFRLQYFHKFIRKVKRKKL